MSECTELHIFRVVMDADHRSRGETVESDVLIVGAGPSRTTSDDDLANAGHKVVVLNRRLPPGG